MSNVLKDANGKVYLSSRGKALISSGTAYIVVTAPVGSLLTCGTQTYQLGAQETEHQFTVTVLGTYTVTATLGEMSKSQTVLVDVFAAYNVELSPKDYIYNLGNEYSSITGGFSFIQSNQGEMVCEKIETSLFVRSLVGYACGFLHTNSQMNITTKQKVIARITTGQINTYWGDYAMVLGITDNGLKIAERPMSNWTVYGLRGSVSANTEYTIECSLLGYTGNYYICFCSYGVITEAHVHEIWFE